MQKIFAPCTKYSKQISCFSHNYSSHETVQCNFCNKSSKCTSLYATYTVMQIDLQQFAQVSKSPDSLISLLIHEHPDFDGLQRNEYKERLQDSRMPMLDLCMKFTNSATYNKKLTLRIAQNNSNYLSLIAIYHKPSQLTCIEQQTHFGLFTHSLAVLFFICLIFVSKIS